MAMIKCPECGKDISDLAKTCPNCGFPIGFESTQNTSFNNYPNTNTQPNISQAVAVKPYESTKKQSKLGILALILSIIGCTFWLGIILAIVDLLKKDDNKKTCSIVAICVSVLWLVIAIGVGGSDNNSDSKKTDTNASNTTYVSEAQDDNATSQETASDTLQENSTAVNESKSESTQMNKEEFANSCVDIPYKTLARNPDDYIGEHLKLTVKVTQIMQGGLFDSGEYYHVYTNDEYDMWFGDEYFMSDGRADKDVKILQDDFLTVYAEFRGTTTIERALTGTKEDVLSIKAIYIDLIEEDEEKNILNSDNDETEIDDSLTMGQRNALKSAQNYLSFTAFSYDGLIRQLEYEQYSHEDAVYAADNCGADWNEQAAKSAKSYLDFMSFSKDGLIEQLEYDGFTHEQAVYGAEQNGY